MWVRVLSGEFNLACDTKTIWKGFEQTLQCIQNNFRNLQNTMSVQKKKSLAAAAIIFMGNSGSGTVDKLQHVYPHCNDTTTWFCMEHNIYNTGLRSSRFSMRGSKTHSETLVYFYNNKVNISRDISLCVSRRLSRWNQNGFVMLTGFPLSRARMGASRVSMTGIW